MLQFNSQPPRPETTVLSPEFDTFLTAHGPKVTGDAVGSFLLAHIEVSEDVTLTALALADMRPSLSDGARKLFLVGIETAIQRNHKERE